MENNEKKQPEEIIKSHMIFSIAAGAIPIPLADIAAVTAIQVDMVKQLSAAYNIPYDENKGKSFASSLAGATLAKFGASLVKAIPGVGSVAGMGMQMVLSGATTYAIGHVFKSHFSKDGSLSDFNVDSVKDMYNSFYEKGKDVAKDLKSKFKKEDSTATLEKLKELKDKGLITDEEFEATKKSILEKMG